MSDTRSEIETWYTRCANLSLLDQDFATRFREQTPQCIAELFFASWLLTHQVSLVRSPHAGARPAADWEATMQSRPDLASFHVEVTCPTDGDRNNVDRLSMASTHLIDSSKMATSAVDWDQIRRAVLRLSSALHEKARSDQAKAAMNAGRPFVVALSTMGFSYPIVESGIDCEFPVPHSALLMRFAYGFSDPMVVRLPPPGNQASSGVLTVSRLPQIEKRRPKDENRAIATGAFIPDCDPTTREHYSSVSAVLFSGWSYQRFEWPPRPRVALLHNSNAKHPLSHQAIPGCWEIWLDQKCASHFQYRCVNTDA